MVVSMKHAKRNHLQRLTHQLVFIFCAVVIAFECAATVHQKQSDHPTPDEVGSVSWSRDYYDALEKSEKTGRPIFLLFQEVPGCIGCKTFGRTVLSDPQLVKVIETDFIPVLVFNNRSHGTDAELLKKFNEPSWNYQVIRFIDSSENDIIPRKDGVWDRTGVASRMISVLETLERPVPRYLKTITVDTSANE